MEDNGLPKVGRLAPDDDDDDAKMSFHVTGAFRYALLNIGKARHLLVRKELYMGSMLFSQRKR